jgi:2-dehydro-3-deoxygalactonokinase
VSGTAYLVSGVRSDDDIMRGEETEVLGAARLLGLETDAVLVLPGTHAKHVRVSGGQMVGFRTFMTGELFDVLTHHSILRHTTEQGRGEPGDAFLEGMAAVASEPLTAAIFRARTRSSLGGLDAESNGAFLSGVLIGAELAAMPRDLPVVLCGGRRLGPLYAAALRELGARDVTVVAPEDVEGLSVLGHTVLLERILP